MTLTSYKDQDTENAQPESMNRVAQTHDALIDCAKKTREFVQLLNDKKQGKGSGKHTF
jgi:hypothetical protein